MKISKLINNKKDILIVNAVIHGDKPYFSITGEIWKANKKGEKTGEDCHTGGGIHDEILKHFPDMQDIVALHLSDKNGIPMFAIANGYYWYKESKEKGFDYIRLPEEKRDIEINDVNEFASLVESMKPQYKQEAEAAIKKYNLV
jgi:hypothetical protein